MSLRLRRRLEAAASRAGMHGPDHVVTVIWDGIREQPWRDRVAEARERGWQLAVIRLALMQVAESTVEAEEMVRRHRAERPGVPISVHDRIDHHRVLAEWQPELPPWLQDEPAAI